MPQVISTNVYSLNTQRHLDKSQGGLSLSLQRLSSGLRVNSAKDDAAGLAISERMSAQISGLDQARRNANDGVSLSQTAESALSTLGEMLRRMRDLAVQAANATNSDADRQTLQEEIIQLKMEITRIGTDTNFNGRTLLDGSFTNQYFQIGAEAGQTSIVNLTDSRAISLGAQFSSESKTMSFDPAASTPRQGHEYSFDINGVRVTVKQTSANMFYTDLKNAINRVAAQTNVKAEYIDPAQPTSGLTLKGATFNIGNFQGKDSAGAVLASGNLPTLAPQVDSINPAGPMDNANAANNGVKAQTLSIYGSLGDEHLSIPAGASAKEIADLVNSIQTNTGVEASARTVAYLAQLGGNGIVGFKLYGSNETAINISADVTTDDLTNLAKAINDMADQTGVTAVLSVDKSEIKLINEDGYDIVIEDFTTSNTTDTKIVVRGPSAIGEEVGPSNPAGAAIELDGALSNNDSMRIAGRVTFDSEKGFRLETTEPGNVLIAGKVYPSMVSLADIEVTTRESAWTAIISIDAALTAINSNRAKLGAIQNRFENAITNLQAVSENLSAARSRIRDTDYAAETSAMASNSIIQQAGIAMMTQANALPQNVLSLLQF